jgi:hypothetical protein
VHNNGVIILQESLSLFKDKNKKNRIQDTDSLQKFPVGVCESVW